MTFCKWMLVSIVTVIMVGCSTEQQATQPTSTTSDKEVAQSEPVYRTLSIDELINVVENEADQYSIVNVHIPYAGEIPHTDVNIAYNDIDTLTSKFPDKNAPIILYCRSGNMSETASRELVELGYSNVYDVPGGMNAWQRSGRELEFADK